MRNITANQLMLMLAVYRGTLENELNAGTRANDMKVLGQLGLVVRARNHQSTYDLTEKGNQLVVAVLAVASTIGSNPIANISVSQGSVDVELQGQQMVCNGPALLGRLDHFPTMHHGDFQVEDTGNALLQLSDVEGDAGRVDGGTFFVVAAAGVRLNPKAESSDEDFGTVELTKIDPVILATEQEATDIAVNRAKSEVGSRHVVLKAVALHEVAVPIKSRRLS